jgi:hypothetical protein
VRIDFDVDDTGPVFDGSAEMAVTTYKEYLENSISDMAVNRIRAYLPTQYMYLGHNGGTPMFNPVPANAGYLASQIHTDRVSDEAVLVTSDPVTYGPWIEGISDLNLVVWPHRRNPPPRRFPGYHAFRLIAQQLNAQAEEIANREIQPYIQEMNS